MSKPLKECSSTFRSCDPELSGFGLYKIKREEDIPDPDDFDWEHDPNSTRCSGCSRRYKIWKQKYSEQQLNRR